ncbi:hypothetical protein [Halodesulfovibrio spirochaetisodalis]|uniref:Transcription factor zinc-finger domain-containing protein n=1 Tax=Halodesulfovibrio spirochaetisodalis TaxID=1560234 RepID=A0A1B7XB10_9BACT|nr:hypothetical protein [Halodesulfovibrio spirochaetisodalis]OBQ46490.1 hypothetical protein SP90_12385 [Halodesulfovibrio spirochaetisodalis]
MVKYIEIEKSGQIYCSDCEQGWIKKFFLKKIKKDIFVCDECESLWFSLKGIILEQSDFFTGYLKRKGYITTEGFDDWDSILEDGDYVNFDEIKDFVEKHKIKVVVLE